MSNQNIGADRAKVSGEGFIKGPDGKIKQTFKFESVLDPSELELLRRLTGRDLEDNTDGSNARDERP